MNFIDTHTHLYDEQLIKDVKILLQKSLDAGVQKMYMPNCNSGTIPEMMRLSEQYPQHCFPMMGLHPCYVKEDYEKELEIVKDYLSKEQFFAVGEIGLDYHWDLSFKEQQIIAFEQQIDWALQYKLPIVIHSRNSTNDCIALIKRKKTAALKGIFHCFGGNLEEAQQIIELGFYLGIGGIVSFKNSTLQDVIKTIGLSNIVLETDAPYLAPVPYRGKRNESSYIPIIAEKIAEILEVAIEEVAVKTTENAENIFNNK